jgi:orotate phosphoribosyltransferase-like protein
MVYVRHGVYLSKHQAEKIRAAAKKNKSVSVRIDPKIRANTHLYLTERQVTSLKKNKPKDITLSMTQLKKNGGFIFSIPAILAGIGAAAGVASSAANIARAINQKKHESKMEKILRGKGVYLPGKKVKKKV